ncbi:hypothetical protein BJ165DRAFT_202887 [Panaeolus papilionaceus]|nr:hypothetical protein BJ165DRAFT_202887 [Panaeolus papilionaceus]
MQDGGERSLSLPLSSSSVLGDVASAAATGLQAGSSGSSENRIFVVATLAAIVLAGSAFAYRARPHAAVSSKNDLATSSLKGTHHGSTDSQPRVVTGGKGKLPEGSSLTPMETLDAKESKTSRSKDRRRRGKDPLKEVLKNPKKLKSLATSTPTSTPPLSARSTIATTSTAATTPNTANSFAHINSIHYNLHHEDETDDSVDPTPEFSSPFDEYTSSSNTSSLQGSITRSEGEQVLQQEIVQRREGAWHDTLPIPGSSDGMISATHTADTSEVSQIDTPHSAQTLPQPHVNESSHTHRRLSQSSNLSLTSGPDLEHHHPQIPNHTYAVPALSSAPSMSQKYASTTRPPSSSSASPSVTPTDKDDSAFGQNFAGTNLNGLLELDDLAAHAISQARARFLARDDTPALGLGLALHSPPTPPDFCSALSSTSSSTESTDLSASTMTTDTSVTSGAASIASAGEDSSKTLQPSANPQQSALSSNTNHTSAESSSSSSSSKTRHAPKAQHLPSAAASASKAKQNAADPWEWDGVTDAVRKQDKVTDSTRKERDAAPKDSPKKASRKAGAAMFSAIVAVAPSSSPAQGVSKELEIIEETPVFFPTLNPTPATSRVKSSQEGSGPSAQQPSTPRRAPTPRRPQTPSYNSNNSSNCSTPPPPSSTSSASSHQPLSAGNNAVPALSTQTQLASMRGALEASRLREEKNKAELERVTKEMERLQWENANCKRGEMEVGPFISTNSNFVPFYPGRRYDHRRQIPFRIEWGFFQV